MFLEDYIKNLDQEDVLIHSIISDPLLLRRIIDYIKVDNSTGLFAVGKISLVVVPVLMFLKSNLQNIVIFDGQQYYGNINLSSVNKIVIFSFEINDQFDIIHLLYNYFKKSNQIVSKNPEIEIYCIFDRRSPSSFPQAQSYENKGIIKINSIVKK